ncbi:MAG: hypothetical protein JW955_10080 [Sedimentisphaerales bacterium]|nr:hypothetical protein [Sedimentisphaerales bacterium]
MKHQNDDYQTYLYNGVMVPIDPLPDANGVGGGGKPGTISVTPGPDGWLDLDLYIRVDDQIDMSTLDFNDPDLNYDYIGSWHGIDLCAVTCIHELVHQDNYLNGGGGSLDDDGDGVITNNEGSANYYLNYCITDTYDVAGTLARGYYGPIGDDEFLCRIREMNYVDPNKMGGSTDPDKDWSKEGKRWHTY